MNDNTRNEFASYGLGILKRSVLLVLYEQYVSGQSHRRFLTIKKIGERLDIRPPNMIGERPDIRPPNMIGERPDIRPGGKYTAMEGLTHGILMHLLADEDVEWLGSGRWRITQKGVSVIDG